eukprot:TRINITY_DN6706_c0_g2_i1.p1 TRINITY_DN6706_c0_g2~~TRINITY_DN6706_c0_g2_i1.p1  ORF type:complete len:471 (-),score=23.07 TRINITY_DN6706_c0_g2_i1:915-2327(-)
MASSAHAHTLWLLFVYFGVCHRLINRSREERLESARLPHSARHGCGNGTSLAGVERDWNFTHILHRANGPVIQHFDGRKFGKWNLSLLSAEERDELRRGPTKPPEPVRATLWVRCWDSETHGSGSTGDFDDAYGYINLNDKLEPKDGQIIWARMKENLNQKKSYPNIDKTRLSFFLIPRGADLNDGLKDDDKVEFQKSGDSWVPTKNGQVLKGEKDTILYDNPAWNRNGYPAMGGIQVWQSQRFYRGSVGVDDTQQWMHDVAASPSEDPIRSRVKVKIWFDPEDEKQGFYTFICHGSKTAGFSNSYGYYYRDQEGLPVEGVITFANVKACKNSFAFVGDVRKDQIGFFICPNGYTHNSWLEDGVFCTFKKVGANWFPFVDGKQVQAESGACLYGEAALNPDGFDYMSDVVTVKGNQNWEDLLGGGDKDRDDVNMDVAYHPYGKPLLPPPVGQQDPKPTEPPAPEVVPPTL